MFGWFKKKHEKPDRPKIYVTARGGLYVKIEELMASKAWDDLMDRMLRERQQRSATGESAGHSQRKQVGERKRTAES